MGALANLLGYQLAWLAAVAGAGRGDAWPALVCAGGFAAWQVATARRRAHELKLAAAALGCGVLLDGALSAAGLLHYATAAPALPQGGAPLWILALWLAFASTLTRSLAFLQTRPWLAVLLGVVGGPLAYLGAAAGWQAVAFDAPAWRALGLLAFGWGLALPLLARLARASKRRTDDALTVRPRLP
ncbi:MAG: hypothetical protein RL684_2831 [Pseudomonadota bacterium]|jgi:hypothetical protein